MSYIPNYLGGVRTSVYGSRYKETLLTYRLLNLAYMAGSDEV